MFERKSWHKFLPDENLKVYKPNLLEFFDTMTERQNIWYSRFILENERPWTKNEILNNSKFTNVYRELDRVSQWGIKNIIQKKQNTFEDLLFKILIFRHFNESMTFDKKQSKFSVELQNYKDFDCNKLHEQVSLYRKKVGNPFTDAYLKNPANLIKPKSWDESKKGKWRDYVYCKTVSIQTHKIIPSLVKIIRSENSRPENIIELLKSIPAVSGFMSYEFYLDFCYITKYSKQYSFPFDENDFVNVGPGCSVGLRLIFPCLKVHEQKEGIVWLKDLSNNFLRNFVYTKWDKNKNKYIFTDKNNITLHQIEMWLCEYQKYWKMKIGMGKQRSKFEPKTKIK